MQLMQRKIFARISLARIVKPNRRSTGTKKGAQKGRPEIRRGDC